MTLLEAVSLRHSRRKYLADPLDSEVVEMLQGLITQSNQIDGVDMRLVLNNGDAFAGLRKSYGMLAGVRNYICLIDRVADPDKPGKNRASENTEKLGYYGELNVLYAVSLGLGTCWVGGSFDRKSCPLELAPGESVVCTITIGYTPEDMSLREGLIKGITHRKTKTAGEMYDADAPVPDWFVHGMQAVQMAPSAVNRQLVRFSYQNGGVSACVPNPSDVMTALDLGIAKLHFELGAGGGTWAFGNRAAFEYKPSR